jgi:hypothetical protein
MKVKIVMKLQEKIIAVNAYYYYYYGTIYLVFRE